MISKASCYECANERYTADIVGKVQLAEDELTRFSPQIDSIFPT